MKRPEKNAQHTKGKGRQFNKRLATRARRRAESKDPENAPTKASYLGTWW